MSILAHFPLGRNKSFTFLSHKRNAALLISSQDNKRNDSFSTTKFILNLWRKLLIFKKLDKTLLGVGIIGMAMISTAEARDQIRIVGSSTVFPFSTAVAEAFEIRRHQCRATGRASRYGQSPMERAII